MHGLPFTPSPMTLIPATIITGFLGSGKTTLLKRLLTEAHGQKIAVIENEFGEEPIDNDILVSDTAEQIIQMNNGCVCCTIREDLRSTLTDLAAAPGFTPKLTEDLGKALTELKLQLAMKGVTKFTYKVKKDGETILITPKYKEK